jgi:tRNA pseudouridine38-40 synthase
MSANEEKQPPLPCYKMTIAYDGTLYGGWQWQINTVSIQSLIQNALSTVLRKPTKVIGSGRTDAGVHALAQIAHFRNTDELDLSRLLFSLNALLPSDIRILAIDSISPFFHARFCAVSKLYHYQLHLDPVIDPFQRLYTHRPSHPVDVALLEEAAQAFIGTHDFTSFANTRSTLSKMGNVRTIYRLDILKREKGLCLAFEGNGFLYKMVRNIVGTLLDVCSGKIPLSDIEKIFAARDRRAARIAAPAQGLFLVRVEYPDHFNTDMASKEAKCSPPSARHVETCAR